MASTSTTVISAERYDRLRQFLKDLWDFHELFITFIQRELKVHYKQTALGVSWVILQPLLGTGAFVIIFGKIARMDPSGLPHVLFYFPAMVAWSTFASALTRCALSMETNVSLITKVYFPRVTLPGSIVVGAMIDFLIGWVVLNLIAIAYSVAKGIPYWHWQLLVLTPPMMVIQSCTALGLGLVLAIINAQYRDVKHGIGFLVQIMLLATPIIYSIGKLLEKLPSWSHPLIALNPMAAVVTTYRDCILGGPFHWQLMGLSTLTSVLYLCFGVWFFRKRESKLADVL